MTSATPMNRHDAALAAVEAEFGDANICKRCGATIKTFDERCSAPLDEACPGFLVIDAAMAAALVDYDAGRLT